MLCRAVTFFSEIVKAAHVRSRAAYRLKIIARTNPIIDQLLGLIYIPIVTLYS
jgi:23S rRNA U2552 (ribose-2'-O)-methylase RlmE/FtsJ